MGRFKEVIHAGLATIMGAGAIGAGAREASASAVVNEAAKQLDPDNRIVTPVLPEDLAANADITFNNPATTQPHPERYDGGVDEVPIENPDDPERQGAPTELMNLEPISLSPEEMALIESLWDLQYPENELQRILDQGGVAEVALPFSSLPIDQFPSGAMRSRIDELIATIVTIPTEGDPLSHFALNVAVRINPETNQPETVVGAREIAYDPVLQNLTEDAVFVIHTEEGQGRITRYLAKTAEEAADDSIHVGFQVADAQTVQEVQQYPVVLPDGTVVGVLNIKEGDILFTKSRLDPATGRSQLMMIMSDAGIPIDLLSASSPGGLPIVITTPEPQRAPGHAMEVVESNSAYFNEGTSEVGSHIVNLPLTDQEKALVEQMWQEGRVRYSPELQSLITSEGQVISENAIPNGDTFYFHPGGLDRLEASTLDIISEFSLNTVNPDGTPGQPVKIIWLANTDYAPDIRLNSNGIDGLQQYFLSQYGSRLAQYGGKTLVFEFVSDVEDINRRENENVPIAIDNGSQLGGFDIDISDDSYKITLFAYGVDNQWQQFSTINMLMNMIFIFAEADELELDLENLGSDWNGIADAINKASYEEVIFFANALNVSFTNVTANPAENSFALGDHRLYSNN